jgi:hypothetical protein
MARTLEDKRVAALELLDERTRRLDEGFDDFKREYKGDRQKLEEIRGTLHRMEGEGLMDKLSRLETRCFGDHSNSLESRVREQEHWRLKIVGMGIAAGTVASLLVSLIMMLVSKRI